MRPRRRDLGGALALARPASDTRSHPRYASSSPLVACRPGSSQTARDPATLGILLHSARPGAGGPCAARTLGFVRLQGPTHPLLLQQPLELTVDGRCSSCLAALPWASLLGLLRSDPPSLPPGGDGRSVAGGALTARGWSTITTCRAAVVAIVAAVAARLRMSITSCLAAVVVVVVMVVVVVDVVLVVTVVVVVIAVVVVVPAPLAQPKPHANELHESTHSVPPDVDQPMNCARASAWVAPPAVSKLKLEEVDTAWL
mmetsp:Transcript_15640/g.39723  ORF Transcript_15640/g.39723 Transcript_15640/m.39723 type:complete len:257 (-) Transcript_15640:955-1725(-)